MQEIFLQWREQVIIYEIIGSVETGTNWSSHLNHEKCEDATCIRNSFWEARIGVFRLLKHRGGVPSGAVLVIAKGLALPEITGILQFSGGNPGISTSCESPVIGGTSASPPEPPLRFAVVLYYLLPAGDATAARGEALRAVAQKER